MGALTSSTTSRATTSSASPSSREIKGWGEWSVSRVMAALQDWNVRFYSYKEPFLDTTGPFAGLLIPLFAWLARQDSIKEGEAVRLGMDKARAKGKPIGRPAVVDKVDAELVVALRNQGKSWREIAAAHPPVKSSSGKKVRPSVGSIRRVFLNATSTGEDRRSSEAHNEASSFK